eukprot:669058-Pyramimonas_sp.AAC.1
MRRKRRRTPSPSNLWWWWWKASRSSMPVNHPERAGLGLGSPWPASQRVQCCEAWEPWHARPRAPRGGQEPC